MPRIAAQRTSFPDGISWELERAVQEVARFDSMTGVMAPVAALLDRAESAASVQIDGRRIPTKQIAMAERGLVRWGHAHALTAVGALHATRVAVRFAYGFDGTALHEVHKAAVRKPRMPLPGTHAALADLFAFMGRHDIPPLAHAALAHAQFELIRPFGEATGIVGRALVQAQLRAKGVVRNLGLPLSAGLLAERDDYREALKAYREGDAAPIIRQFARATLAGVANGRALGADLEAVHHYWRGALAGIRRDAVVWKMLPVVLEHPLVDAPTLLPRLDASLVAVYTGLRTLEERQVITPLEPGAVRNRSWYTRDVLSVLERFQFRALSPLRSRSGNVR